MVALTNVNLKGGKENLLFSQRLIIALMFYKLFILNDLLEFFAFLFFD